ncbi:MAG: ankyrin repeat domain-containing protein [Candidatus Kapaibacterium sp.]
MNNEQKIIEAIKAGDVEQVKSLIEIDIFLADATGPDGISALLTALYHDQERIAEIILASAPTLTIHEAAAAGLKDQVESHLADLPEAVASVSHDGWTPLHLAVYFNRNAVAELLIARGADVNAISRNSLGVTPLHSALANRNSRLGMLLLRKGADPSEKQSGVGYTPLHYAAANGMADIVGVLLEREVDVAAETDDGRTALAIAREKGEKAVVALLENHGAGNG